MFARWLARAVSLLLICLQPVPLLGAFSLPLMGLANFLVYRGLLRRQGRAILVRAPAPAPA